MSHHKKKLVVQGGKELDLLSSPPRVPSCAHALPPPTLPRPAAPPSYWAPGSAAAAARRTREVADELFWAAVERGDDRDVADTGLTRKARQHSAAAATRPASVASATTAATTTRSVLSRVDGVTTMPLSSTRVSADLRNLAADGVRLALRGRAQWEHNQKRLFGATAVVRALAASAAAASSASPTRPQSANPPLLSSPAVSRPGTAGTVATRSSSLSAFGATGSGFNQRGASIDSVRHIFAPNNQNRLDTPPSPAVSRPGSAVTRPNTAATTATTATPSRRPQSAVSRVSGGEHALPPRWQDFDSAFHSSLAANREIFEFERRCATAARYSKALQKPDATPIRRAPNADDGGDTPPAARDSAAAAVDADAASAVKPCRDASCLEELHMFA